MDTLTRMRAFIDVVEAEGFSAAARKIGRSKALLSKYVRELEDELGALLLNRTTRQFSLTEAGHTYYQRASEILRDVESLQETVRDSSSDIRGRIKISASRSFADADIGQCLIDFCAEQPDIILDVRLDDRFVDLVEEGFDLAIRITRMQDSSLIAKRIAPFRVIACATPELIQRVGKPGRPEQLVSLPCIVDTNNRSRNTWQFHKDGEPPVSVQLSGPLEINSPLATRRAALAGLGFALLPDFIARPDIESGRLVAVLEDFIMHDAGIYAVYPHRRYLPAKVRVLVDFLTKWFKDNRRA
ncbi:LysR family transcriptional regulator [Phyllobacterium endophyticum]|jgi:DNA-binding transcriptional LysR family regulator|uniref:LysR family transcriptional regulator n=1 Tax=Phyllobacterium endophyticum TaxID=1149773 RepID=A0A2P7AKX5_9HYPH|nr:LysR family transcriptional regulator [Phyllobacterium endophyticum]MBB3233239.1 DNA-binding transcriptional LysR family regulator [Phyllobacterium endophyticum]PSH54872.1 LysR family transcriptional regulator [Phyllobacterium endophyticum]TXR46954.1 LysR family transcriptional regulator [Phyllobacterium endophyticum]TYR43259.1 LysR family transcriptional regulator [Phyllobacterium endophyticum]